MMNLNVAKSNSPMIVYTKTDEAPALATCSLFPVIRSFTKPFGITVEERNISLANRILSAFSECLTEDQRVGDDMEELRRLTDSADANIIKLPNISASTPQLRAAITELQQKGYTIPDYPGSVPSSEKHLVKRLYDGVKGSAVNPVLREGNSDRRVPRPVKVYAQSNPHSMWEWSRNCKSQVATMASEDFKNSEKSVTVSEATNARIEFVGEDGVISTLKEPFFLETGEVVDGARMNHQALLVFLRKQVARAKDEGILFSLHLKATMMKACDPIIFGTCVEVYFSELISKHRAALRRLGVDFRNGLSDLFARLDETTAEERAEIRSDIDAVIASGPDLAMVNSEKGISNLNVPSDVIIDASMPAMIRSSGKMWDAAGKPRDTLAVIPDSSYAGVYQVVIDYCRDNGAFDPARVGSVANVGLMARQAEEYGSHDKTFQASGDGTIRLIDTSGRVLIEHTVKAGDIWRACQTKNDAINDWVSLAVERMRASGWPGVFWLDESRAHDSQLIAKVERCLESYDLEGLELHILSPVEAMKYTLERFARGENTISITGNILRDYLTDLFPILEVGTSAKVLSIVPLMKRGRLFETGAGGSAPKHVLQLLQENYLRWDSLGEFLALSASLEHLGKMTGSQEADVLGKTLALAIETLLREQKSPSRRIGGIDNRGSHFYLALYWAGALAAQNENSHLRAHFKLVAEQLKSNEVKIVDELVRVQGKPVDIGGYFKPEQAKMEAVMRPSKAFNAIIDSQLG